VLGASLHLPRVQISTLLNIQAWQSRNENARVADQQELNQSLSNLETNYQQLKETLGVFGMVKPKMDLLLFVGLRYTAKEHDGYDGIPSAAPASWINRRSGTAIFRPYPSIPHNI